MAKEKLEKEVKKEEVEVNETQISFVKEDGTEELCQILFTFEDEDKKKNYMFFYPISAVEGAEEEEDVDVYCATYEIKDGEIVNVKEVDSDDEEENKLIEEVFNQYLEDCECDDCECDDENCECHHHHK